MDAESMLSSFSLNNSSSINKSTYSTCNLQLNSNSNANSSISNNLVGNGGIANQHTMMKTNNIVNNTSECNKLQLVSNPNLNMFVSDANGRNVNEESIKDENIANYKNSHLIDDSHKFNLNNKHIPCQQQRDSQNNHYTQMMNDINGSSMPLNLCQVGLPFITKVAAFNLESRPWQVQQSNFFSNGHHKQIDEHSIKKEIDPSMCILSKEFEDKKDDNIFDPTLNLSQEDIQQTLSANMPGHRNEESIVHDTISFIGNCSSSVQEEDDSFVNLDAFDMLIELPELESARNHAMAKSSHENSMLNITEFCPDWSFVEGGVKILITGPWAMESSYTAYFDNISVQATVVQNGVLKLFAPKHEPGVCKVCISDGFSFSNMVDFEYKLQPNFEYGHVEILYKFSLQNRLQAINNELCSVKTESNDKSESSNLFDDPDFENYLIQYCNKIASKQLHVSKNDFLPVGKIDGMTVLHLASFLGYTNLVGWLLKWISGNHSQLLKSEINVRSQNKDGNTPLMVAALNGFLNTGRLSSSQRFPILNFTFLSNLALQMGLHVAKDQKFRQQKHLWFVRGEEVSESSFNMKRLFQSSPF